MKNCVTSSPVTFSTFGLSVTRVLPVNSTVVFTAAGNVNVSLAAKFVLVWPKTPSAILTSSVAVIIAPIKIMKIALPLD